LYSVVSVYRSDWYGDIVNSDAYCVECGMRIPSKFSDGDEQDAFLLLPWNCTVALLCCETSLKTVHSVFIQSIPSFATGNHSHHHSVNLSPNYIMFLYTSEFHKEMNHSSDAVGRGFTKMLRISAIGKVMTQVGKASHRIEEWLGHLDNTEVWIHHLFHFGVNLTPSFLTFTYCRTFHRLSYLALTFTYTSFLLITTSFKKNKKASVRKKYRVKVSQGGNKHFTRKWQCSEVDGRRYLNFNSFQWKWGHFFI
jgi:hypothetical protein